MKKQCYSGIIIVVTISSFFTSCVGGSLIDDPYDVAPARQRENFFTTPPSSTPVLLNKNNDLTFSWQRGINNMAVTHDFSGAMLVTDNMGIASKFQMVNDDNYVERMNGGRWEGSVGYVKNYKSAMMFEVYGGGGFGTIRNTHHTGSSVINTSNFFIQPGLGLVDKKGHFKIGIASRFGAENLNLKSVFFDMDREKINALEFSRMKDQPFSFYVEPSFIGQAGWKAIQINTGFTLREDFSDRNLHGPKSRYFIGLSFLFNTKIADNTHSKTQQ